MAKLKLRTKPYPHQIKAVRRAVAQGNHGFFFEPRCGKSKAALDAVAVLAHRGVVKRVVIIAPIIASDVWVRQLHEHFSLDYRYLDVWGDKRVVKGRGKPLVGFFFVNVDKLSYRKDRGNRWEHTYAEMIERFNPDLIIFDESHRLKRAGGVGAQTAWHMVRRIRRLRGGGDASGGDTHGPPFVYLLTGTPNPKGFIDLFAQFRIMDDSILGTAKSGFEEAYCVYGKGSRQWTIVKYRNKRQLLKTVHRHATVVNAAEAGLRNEFVPNPIRISLPPKAKELYDRFVKEQILELPGGTILDAKNAGVLRLRALQLSGGFTTSGEQVHNAKLSAFTDFASDLLEQDQSMVVGTRFIPEVRAISDTLKRMGYRVGTIYGDIPRADRNKAIASFQHHAERTPSVLVFQSQAGSLALELTQAAEVVFYSLPDSWETFWQFINRLGGPNQKHWPVRWTSFLAKGTADSRVLQVLRDKRDMHAEMMKSPKDFFRGL